MRALFLLHFICAVFFVSAQTWKWDLKVPFNSNQKLIRSVNGEIYEIESHKFTRRDKWGQPEITLTFPQNIELAGLAANSQKIWVLSNSIDSQYNSLTILSEYDRGGKLEWVKTVTGNYFHIGNRGSAIVLQGDRLLISGVMSSDTVDFLGTPITRDRNCHAYVAECSLSGSLKKINSLRSGYITPDTLPESYPREFIVDERGNSYLYVFCKGRTVIGDDTIKQRFFESQHVVVKFDADLQIKYKTEVYGNCDWLCYPPNNMRVNSRGEVFMLSQYHYGQSGNDDENTHLFRLKANGVLDTNILLTGKGTIRSMDIDSCDNVVLAGYERYGANSIPFKRWMKTFELGPDLALNWQLTDTSSSEGFEILSINRSEVFVKGLFYDSVKLKNTLYSGPSSAGGYYAMLGFAANKCSSVLDVKSSNSSHDNIRFYPNPSYGELNVEAADASSYTITNSLGKVIKAGVIQTGINRFKLDLPPGIYLISFGKNQLSKKLIVN